MTLTRHSPMMVALLAAFAALWPMLIEMYLPIMPTMVAATGSSISVIQFTISSTLTGFACAYLLVGPLADRFGRNPVLLGGIALYGFAAIGIALSNTIPEIIGWRLLQGIAACCCPALVRTIIQDLYGSRDGAQKLGYMAALMTAGTMLTPLLAGWMIGWLLWQSVFWFMAGYAAMVWVLVYIFLPESIHAERSSLSLRRILKTYARMLRNRRFMSSTLGIGVVFSGNTCFVALGSFILIGQMQVSPTTFGLWFIVIECGFIVGSMLTARFSHRLAPRTTQLAGVLLACTAGLLMAGMSMVLSHPLAVVLPMAAYTCALGIVLPQSSTHALSPFPAHTGAAASLLGFLQMTVAALASAVVGAIPIVSTGMLAAALLTCGVIALCLLPAMGLATTLADKQLPNNAA